MDDKVVEAVALDSSANGNVEILGMVPNGQVEVSKKGNEAARKPIANRPSRARKIIERFNASNEEVKNTKQFSIETGRGMPLKDIPNIADKVHKRGRMDEILILVHTLLYGKRGKGIHMKDNILQFSGFVWGQDEEKRKEKLEDKLHKHNKEILFQLCHLLDIHVSKTNTKKEELVDKLIEFLECPHGTTDLIVDETTQKETAKKRKRNRNGTLAKIQNKDVPRKRQKNIVVTQEEKGQTEDENRNEDAKEENYAQEVDPEEGKAIDGDYAVKKTVRKRLQKNTKENNDAFVVDAGRKKGRKQDNGASAEKSNSKDKEVANNDNAETNYSLNPPSNNDLVSAISEIIAEVADFEMTTYRDITKQLELRFGTDFSERKMELRRMIQRELSRLVDTDEAESDARLIHL